MTLNHLDNFLWMLANDKKEEFLFWCKQNGDLDPENLWTLQLFVNEEQKIGEFEKMTESFSKLSDFFNGFLICWPTKNAGMCHIFNKSKKEIETLFADLKSKIENVEKYKVTNGQLHRLA